MRVDNFSRKPRSLLESFYRYEISSVLLLGVFLLVVLLLISGCTQSEPRYNFTKQQEFEALFSSGMSQEEVEQILDELGDYDLFRTWITENGNIHLAYRTQSDYWGAPVYYFHFSPDGTLLALNPPEPI